MPRVLSGGGVLIDWLYALPSVGLFVLVCGLTMAVGVVGGLLVRMTLEKKLGLSEQTNTLIGYFLSFTGVFYGIMLGLVSVGAWERFRDVEAKVGVEAADIAAFYRDVAHLPEPMRTTLTAKTRQYTRFVIDQAWPAQQQGLVPKGGTQLVTEIGDVLYAIEPATGREEIVMAETLGRFNQLVSSRRQRLQSINQSLPASLWVVILVGTILNMALTWLLVIGNRWLDVSINSIVAMLLGSFLYFIVAMDHPFRGRLSVSSEPYQQVYDSLMLQEAQKAQ